MKKIVSLRVELLLTDRNPGSSRLQILFVRTVSVNLIGKINNKSDSHSSQIQPIKEEISTALIIMTKINKNEPYRFEYHLNWHRNVAGEGQIA